MLMDESEQEQRPTTPTNAVDRKHPLKSPTKSRQTADRFIPDRNGSNATNLALRTTPKKVKVSQDNDIKRQDADKLYSGALKSELFGVDTERILQLQKSPPGKVRHTLDMRIVKSPLDQQFATTPLSPTTSHKLRLSSTLQKSLRAPIPKLPYKVLDAPELADDFYLNLICWSSTNILAVGLSNSVYLWKADNSNVEKLCDLGQYDSVTSVSWNKAGTLLAVGTNRGMVQIWDAAAQKMVRNISGHTSRVGSMSWNDEVLCTGSRDRSIQLRDMRQSELTSIKLLAHKQEVCGLKWSPSGDMLASGGNDNKLLVWDAKFLQRSTEEVLPRLTFPEHNAAVKAVAWSPHQSGLLASGGGTADRRIRFWNTSTGTPLQCIDTGSQVCNIAWSPNSNELVSTHGYSQNQVVVWKYPTMTQLATLTGHTYRVLYLSMSPDGTSVVTGAGDEQIRFWQVFNKKSRVSDQYQQSQQLMRTTIR